MGVLGKDGWDGMGWDIYMDELTFMCETIDIRL